MLLQSLTTDLAPLSLHNARAETYSAGFPPPDAVCYNKGTFSREGGGPGGAKREHMKARSHDVYSKAPAAVS